MWHVDYLRLPSGREPFREWFSRLDIITRMKIRSYIDRVAAGGGKKNVRSLGDGVFEIKMKFGPGFRVYFAHKKTCSYYCS